MNWNNRLSRTGLSAEASDIREALKLAGRPGVISFALGLPDPALFPLAEFNRAFSEITDLYGPQVFQYSLTDGIQPLRERLAQVVNQENTAASGPVSPDNILITTGSQQGLDLIGRALLNPGDTVIIEAPTYVGALQAFRSQQPRYELIGMDAAGLRMDLLDATLARLKKEGRPVKLLYTVPTFQNPGGVTMSPVRRQCLIELADEHDFLIIEDEPYSRLRFRGEPVPSLRSLDTTGRVISLRTFSKTLGPGLRTGYICGPEPVVRRLAVLKQGFDLCSPALNQFLILRMLETGAVERYVQNVIAVYRQKALVMSQALKEYLGDSPASWNDPEGGMFLWLQLPEGADSGSLLPDAIEAGVIFVKGTAFYPDGSGGRNCLRLNFSYPAAQQIETGVARLAGVITAGLRQAGGLVAI